MNRSEISTEEKILTAAGKIFVEKGYAAARTRDIAKEAGINTALLNYYFRSKDKLFEEVLNLKMTQLGAMLLPTFTNEKTSLKTKVRQIADIYITLLSENPKLPIFIIAEMQKNNFNLFKIFPIKKMFNGSVMVKQIKEINSSLNPLHFLLNLLSICIFPFIAQPVLINLGLLNKKEAKTFAEERKEIIYKWLDAILNI